MKRFVDLRQAGLDEEGFCFAWWDTVTDSFETHSGNQVWEFWEDFVGDFKGDNLERYEALRPTWTLL